MEMKEYNRAVVLSFSEKQREYVERVSDELTRLNVEHFYDNKERGALWGKDLPRYLHKVYSEEAQFMVAFISKDYAEAKWPNHELSAALERHINEIGPDYQRYILPVYFDDTRIDGIPSTLGYLDANKITPEDLALEIYNKLHSSAEAIKAPENSIQSTEKESDDTQNDQITAQKILPVVMTSIVIFILIWAAYLASKSLFHMVTETYPQMESTSPTEIDAKALAWEEIKAAEPGQVIPFGEYWQRETSDKEEIKWLVLSKENDRMLILSEKCLYCMPFNIAGGACTWETSSIRSWLNDEFLKDAFDSQEREKIVDTNVKTGGNPNFSSVYTCDDTNDKIFLLSIEEVLYFFKTPKERQARPTEYAMSKGSGFDHEIEGGPCWWWLRTSGLNNGNAADVKSGGAINYEGYPVNSKNFSVRPALWLDLKS